MKLCHAFLLSHLIFFPVITLAVEFPYTLLTNHPASDSQPSISPDGEALVFVSNRTGNRAIYTVSLKNSDERFPKQIAASPGQSHTPVFSPDGENLVFLSNRDDALNDVYIIDFPSESPKRISTPDSIDSSLTFQSEETLLIGGETIDGESTWRLFNVSSEELSIASSPQEYETPFPVVGHDSSGTFFLLRSDDTNTNNLYDEGDPPSIWKVTDGGWRRLSGPISGATAVDSFEDRLYVSANWNGQSDIAEINEFDLFSTEFTTLLKKAKELETSSVYDPSSVIAAFSAAFQIAGDFEQKRMALLPLTQLLLQEERNWEAANLIHSTGIENYPKEESDLLSIRKVLADFFSSSTITDDAALEELNNFGEENRDVFYEKQFAIALIQRHLENPTAAIGAVNAVIEAEPQASGNQLARAYLIRTEIQTELNLPFETNQIFQRLSEADVTDRHTMSELSGLIINNIRESAENNELALLQLRNMAAAMTDYPYITVQTRRTEADLLTAMGEPDEAVKALSIALDTAEIDKISRAEATKQLADLYAGRGDFKNAIDVLQEQSELLDSQDSQIRSILGEIESTIQSYYVRKGRLELRLGDSMLALNTFEELLEFSPRNLEGWRGKIQALSSREELLNDSIADFRREYHQDTDDPMMAWRYAIALSYPKPASRRAEKLIRKAISLDPSKPHYYLTLGFILEQQFRDEEDKGGGDMRKLEEAVNLYDQALSFTREREEDRLIKADLLLNAANTAFLLQQFFKAHTLYNQRKQTAVEFPTPQTEFFFHYYSGIAAFRSSHGSFAIQNFTSAINTLDELNRKDLIQKEAADSLELELYGRRALAQLDLNRLDEAGKGFRRLTELYPPNTLELARSYRNLSFVNFRESELYTADQQFDILLQARTYAKKALEVLNSEDLTVLAEQSGASGFISINMQLTSAATGVGAKLDLDETDESRLLHGLLAMIENRIGNYEQSKLHRELQIQSGPEITDSNRPYESATRSVIEDQISNLARNIDEPASALDAAIRGFEFSHFEIAGAVTINTNAATRHLHRIVELLIGFPELEIPNRSQFWVSITEPFTGDDLKFLSRVADTLLSMEHPAYPGTQLITSEIEKARLLSIKAHLAEAMLTEFKTTLQADGLAMVRAVKDISLQSKEIDRIADEMDSLLLSPARLEEIKYHRFQLYALQLRTSSSTEGRDDLLQNALNWTELHGYHSNKWQLPVQAAISAKNTISQVKYCRQALELLEKTWPLRNELSTELDLRLATICEQVLLADSLEQNDYEGLWNLTERFRVIQLRYLAEQTSAPVQTPDELRKVRDYLSLVEEARSVQASLRRLPSANQARRDFLINTYTDLLSEAKEWHMERDSKAMRYYHPVPYYLEDLAGFISPPWIYNPQPALFLSRQINQTEVALLFTHNDIQMIKKRDQVLDGYTLFQYGDADEKEGISLLSGESLYQMLEEPVFEDGSPVISWDGDIRLDTIKRLKLESPINAYGFQPSNWLTTDGVKVQSILINATNLNQLIYQLSTPPSQNPSSDKLKNLSFLSSLYTNEISQAIRGNKRWLGPFLSPQEAPDLARQELEIARSRALRLLEEKDYGGSIATMQTLIFLMESLGPENLPELYNDESSYTEELANIYGKLAEANARRRRPEAALDAIENRFERIQINQLSEGVIATEYQWAGGVTSIAGAHNESEEYYRQAAELFETIGDEENSVNAKLSRVISLENASRFTEAYELGQELLERTDRQDASSQIDQLIRLARLARIYLNDYFSAEAHLMEAKTLAEKINNDELIVESLFNLSRVYQALGNFESAVTMLETIQPFDLSLQRKGELHLEWANIHWYRSEYFDAFREQGEALRIAEETERLALKVAALNTAGLIYWSLNETERALDQLDQAYSASQLYGVPAEIATTANNKGIVYRSSGDYESASQWLDEALAIDRNEGNRWGEAYSLRNIALNHFLAGDPMAAIEPAESAIRLTREIGDQVNEAKALLALGEILTELGDPDAVSHLENALFLAENIPLPEVRWRSLYQLAIIAKTNGESDQAAGYLAEAIDIVDQLRASIRIEEFQNGFLADKQSLYDEMVRLRLDRGEIELAFEASEKSRGRNFIDLLGNQEINLAIPDDEETLSRERELRERITRLEKERSAALEQELADINTRLERARRDYTEFFIRLRAQNPQLSAFVRVPPVETQELQQLIDPDSRWVVYHLLPEQTVIFLLGPDSLTAQTVRAERMELEEQILRIRQSIQNFEPVEASLQQLSEVLITPILPELTGVNRLGIVPHRQLHSLPFSALPAGASPALIDRFALYFSPSAGVFRYTINRRAEGRAEEAVGIGNPDRGEEVYNLPFAQKEVERLRYRFPSILLRLGEDATEEWALDNLGRFSIIHIASHGEYVPEMPLFSGLLLRGDEERDGTLSAKEVFSLKLRADMVALSACQTGLGRVSNGDDIVGLNRSFVYAGTRQLLSTLWRVDDVSTALLFKHFYRQVGETDRAEALRRAQVELKSRQEYQHPAHWASVALSGDWQ